MSDDPATTLAWIRIGGVCGLLGIGAYLAAAFVPLPDLLGYAAAFALGPLLAVGAAGLYHCLALHRRTPLAQIAAGAAIAGGITLLVMLTTQQAIVALTRRAIAGATDTASADVYRTVAEGLNAVHLGIDVAWDVLISVAVVLFGLAMLRHPRFGPVVGGIGIVLGLLLLGFNLWHFPTPPVNASSVDWGPFVALWMLLVFVMLLRSRAWARAASRT
jgi:hypothetical protein